MSGRPPGLEAARAELRALYDELAAEIARAAPVCEISGRCCRFADYGHDLFVTDLELAELFALHPPRQADESVCPYLDGKACGAREGRPLGCRQFFCDPGFEALMPELAARFHARLQAIHEAHAIPYRYGELLRMLAAPADWTAPVS